MGDFIQNYGGDLSNFRSNNSICSAGIGSYKGCLYGRRLEQEF